MVAVQVAACVDVGQADRLPTLYRGASFADAGGLAPHSPVAVAVVHICDSGHRLLPTAWSKREEHMQVTLTRPAHSTSILPIHPAKRFTDSN